LTLLVLAGCAAPKPVLYPNSHFQSVGAATAERDITECRKLAETAGARPRAGEAAEVAGTTAVGAGVGAASGAVGGAIVGSAGTGAAVGAASGAAAGLLGGLLGAMFRRPAPNGAYQGVVDRCLREKGYEPAGWQ
jgi:hypothetical protein